MDIFLPIKIQEMGKSLTFYTSPSLSWPTFQLLLCGFKPSLSYTHIGEFMCITRSKPFFHHFWYTMFTYCIIPTRFAKTTIPYTSKHMYVTTTTTTCAHLSFAIRSLQFHFVYFACRHFTLIIFHTFLFWLLFVCTIHTVPVLFHLLCSFSLSPSHSMDSFRIYRTRDFILNWSLLFFHTFVGIFTCHC